MALSVQMNHRHRLLKRSKPRPAGFTARALPPLRTFKKIESAVARLGSARLRTAGDIHLLTYSPDGKLVATGGRESGIRLWDRKTGKLVRVLNRGKKGGFATALLFSKEGSRLMACNESSPTARRWEVATGQELPAQEWKEAGKECVSAALSPDGKVIASGGSDGTSSLHDVVTGRQVARVDWQKGPVGAVAFSPDGKDAMAGTSGPATEVCRWEPSTGNQLARIQMPPKIITSLVFSPDGTFSAYNRLDTMQVYFHPLTVASDTRTLEVTELHSSSFAFSPDGRFVATGAWGYGVDPKSYARGVRVWELASGKEVCHFNPGATIPAILTREATAALHRTVK